MEVIIVDGLRFSSNSHQMFSLVSWIFLFKQKLKIPIWRPVASNQSFQNRVYGLLGESVFLPLNINILELFKKIFIQQNSTYLSVPRSPGLIASVALEAVPKFDKKSKKLILFIHIKSNGKYVFFQFFLQ
jgi:hypothetical protein